MLSTLESLGTTVYMVVFVKCGFDEVCEVPEDLKETMEREEKEWGELRDIWNRKKEIVDLKIHGNGNGNGNGAEVEKISVKVSEEWSMLLGDAISKPDRYARRRIPKLCPIYSRISATRRTSRLRIAD